MKRGVLALFLLATITPPPIALVIGAASPAVAAGEESPARDRSFLTEAARDGLRPALLALEGHVDLRAVGLLRPDRNGLCERRALLVTLVLRLLDLAKGAVRVLQRLLDRAQVLAPQLRDDALGAAAHAVDVRHRRRANDGEWVGVSKMGWTTISHDNGETWSQPAVPPTLVTGKAKVWSQRTSDGRYALVLGGIDARMLDLYRSSIVTWPEGRGPEPASRASAITTG